MFGTVTDPTGAVIPGAAVHVSREGGADEGAPEGQTDRTGSFQISVAEGTYVVRIEAQGFASFTSRPLAVKPGQRIGLPVRLTVAGLHEELSIDDSEETSGTNAAGDLIFEGDSLRMLSDDAATLGQQLGALAGGTGPPRFVIDGFGGGRLPPKSSIRSIRINGNAYSAYFSDLGMGRVEIFTKPGTDKLHGQLNLSGTDQPLDAPNPYVALTLPFYDFQQDGNLTGPIGKKTSYFVSDAIDSLANNAAVNAANPLNPSATISEGLPAPQRTDTFSVRFDRQFSATNFGHIRDEWSQTHILNSGIAPLVLPDAAFTSDILTNTLQLADTQTLGAHAVNDLRFQYLRTRLRQDPNSTLPSVVVQSSFQNGGSPAQTLRDNQDAFELQELLEVDHGHHSIRTGFRFRAVRDANESSANFNGEYIFPDAASYLAGQASQFSITTGQQGAVLRNDDLGIFAEDDWKLTPDFSFSYGFRFESESAVPDHVDPAPRASFSWAIRPGKRKTPIVTLRGGYGIFYDRFPVAQLLESVRQNGVREVAYFVQDTGFNPNGPPPGVTLSATEPTIYRVNPFLRTSYVQSSVLRVTRSLGRFGAVQGSFIYEHNTHNYLTRNINAPLPGTFDPASPNSGVRPLGTAQNIYQFSSDANGNHELFYLSYQLRITSKLMANGKMVFNKLYDESDGVDRFPSNQYNLRQDYARAATDAAQSYSGGLLWSLPLGLQATLGAAAHSGLPFDITTGADLNGDTIYNDRPSPATDLTRASVVRTAFGNFDTAPAAGQSILPRNYGTAPPLVWLDVQLGKDFHVGPRPQAASSNGRPAPQPDRPWALGFTVEAQNPINHNNPGLPVGVLGAQPCGSASTAPCTCAVGLCSLAPSQYFGHSLSLANDFSPNTASNRTIFLKTSFTF